MDVAQSVGRDVQTREQPVTGGGVVFVVYAPFGDDVALSNYPDGASRPLAQHPLVANLARVADHGAHVVALIDRAGEDTYLVEIPACDGNAIQITSRWKQDMSSYRALRGLLQYAQRKHPGAQIILALEGHGAGYLPELDLSALTSEAVTGDGKYRWTMDHGGWQPEPAPANGGQPALPIKSPVLPIKSPVLPVKISALSTWAIGQALKEAQCGGAPKVAVVHFNNCFNFSLELLHTIAPYAEYAVGYPSYNFFTAGDAYPRVFEGVNQAGLMPAQPARRFAEANHAVLSQIEGHPTVGGVVALRQVEEIVDRVDDLAAALIHALPAQIERISRAVRRALQYDTTSSTGGAGDFRLEVPDDLTDVRDFAGALMAAFGVGTAVHDRAAGVFHALNGVKVYGDAGRPWPNPAEVWDFAGNIAISLFLPNPRRRDLWDWRTPYYLNITEDAVQPHIIEFLKSTAWVDFILKYHEKTPFKGFRAATLPPFPVFNPRAPEIIKDYLDRQRYGQDQSAQSSGPQQAT